MATMEAKANETPLETYERLERNWREAMEEANSLYRQLLIAAEKVIEDNRKRRL